MKKNVFTRSIQLLIVVLLLLAVLIPRALSQKLMIAAVLLWLICITGYALSRNLHGSFNAATLKKAVKRKLPRPVKVSDSSSDEDKEPDNIPVPPSPFHREKEEAVMLQHIALRITDKLKSAYPDATWKWKAEPSLQSILSGSTHRIIVDAMEKYTHADISFDKFARIHVEPLILGTFKPSPAPGQPDDEDTDEKEPDVVDAKVWYEMIGHKILETQITELNCKGHTKLTVKENGDIVIRKQGKDILTGSLDAFPAKNYWKEIIGLLEADELNGKIAGETLQISWT